MTITGLHSNLAYVGNDLWITLSDFVKTPTRIDITYTNTTTSETLPAFQLYPSPTNTAEFNVCYPARALFADIAIDFTTKKPNSLQKVNVDFKVYYDDNTSGDFTRDILFSFGYVDRYNTDGEYFEPALDKALHVGPWPIWPNILFPVMPLAIKPETYELINKMPEEIQNMHLRACKYMTCVFVNSLGGVSYWIFDAWSRKTKLKEGKRIPIRTNRLRVDNFKQIESQVEETIEFVGDIPSNMAPVIDELTKSNCVYLLDDSGKYMRVAQAGNSFEVNSYMPRQEYKLEFTLPKFKSL